MTRCTPDVVEARAMLDRALVSDDLNDRSNLKALILTELMKERGLGVAAGGRGIDGAHMKLLPDEVSPAYLERRTSEIWQFLECMRSVEGESVADLKTDGGGLTRVDSLDSTSSNDWKVKESNSEYRVLYKKGEEGTPFHSLCLEGVVEGPAVTALCVAWEAPHFKDWWPQFAVPPFKIVDSRWLKRIRAGQDVAYVRFKVPWPFAPREIAISAFEFESEEHGMVVASMNSVETTEAWSQEEQGFGASDIPPPHATSVRMGVVGGYCLQQISDTHCYFRTISNIDMKLELVPAWVINFMSRQLAGSGYKLFQEVILNVTRNEKGAGDVFRPILARDPLYKRVRGTMLRARQLADGGQETANGIVERNEKGKAEEEEEEGLRERDPEMHAALETVNKAIALIRRIGGRHQQATAGITGSSERGVAGEGGRENGGEQAGEPRSGDAEVPAVALLVSGEGQVSESEISSEGSRVHKAIMRFEEGGSGHKSTPFSSSPQPPSTPRRVEGGSGDSRRKRIGAGITRLTRRLSGVFKDEDAGVLRSQKST